MWEEHGVARPCLTFFSLYGLLCSLRVCIHAPARCGALGSPGARTRRRGTPRNVSLGPGPCPVLGEAVTSSGFGFSFPKQDVICFDSWTRELPSHLIQRISPGTGCAQGALRASAAGKEEAALTPSLMSSQSGEGDKRGNK